MKKLIAIITAVMLLTPAVYAQKTSGQTDQNIDQIHKAVVSKMSQALGGEKLADSQVKHIQSRDINDTMIDVMIYFDGQEEIAKVKELLDNGADANYTYQNGGENGYKETILQLAVQRGEPEVVEMLLKAGANPNVITPGHKGIKQIDADCNEYYETTTALREAACGPVGACYRDTNKINEQQIEKIKLLLQYHAKVNQKLITSKIDDKAWAEKRKQGKGCSNAVKVKESVLEEVSRLVKSGDFGRSCEMVFELLSNAK
jgi:hypothetical protein